MEDSLLDWYWYNGRVKNIFFDETGGRWEAFRERIMGGEKMRGEDFFYFDILKIKISVKKKNRNQAKSKLCWVKWLGCVHLRKRGTWFS